MKTPVNAIANTVNGHDGTLRIASEPGNIIVESALPATIRLTGIRCSTAHTFKRELATSPLKEWR